MIILTETGQAVAKETVSGSARKLAHYLSVEVQAAEPGWAVASGYQSPRQTQFTLRFAF